MRRPLVLVLTALFVASTIGADGCGTDYSSHDDGARAKRTAKKARAKRNAAHARARRATKARAAARERARRARARARARARRRKAAQPVAAPPPRSNCDPNYSGCLDPDASDYDCEGGSGDGPKYTGTVTVLGVDHYDLNRDDDNIACDP